MRDSIKRPKIKSLGVTTCIFKNIFKILKKKYEFFNFVLYLKFFLKYNFLHGHKRGTNRKKPLYSTCMQYEMPQSLLVFAVSFTPELDA